MKHNQGFTLVELIITLAILAVLSSIAYGSYTRYIVRNAEAQAEARMRSLSMEMERFRSSRLTYRGFIPKKISGGTESYAYEDGSKTVHTNDTQNRYVISIMDSQGVALGEANADGSRWVMLAVPNDEAMSAIKYKYFLSSTGQRCRSMSSDFSYTTDCTGAGVESW